MSINKRESGSNGGTHFAGYHHSGGKQASTWPKIRYSQALRLAGWKRSICASRWLLKRPSVVFP